MQKSQISITFMLVMDRSWSPARAVMNVSAACQVGSSPPSDPYKPPGWLQQMKLKPVKSRKVTLHSHATNSLLMISDSPMAKLRDSCVCVCVYLSLSEEPEPSCCFNKGWKEMEAEAAFEQRADWLSEDPPILGLCCADRPRPEEGHRQLINTF